MKTTAFTLGAISLLRITAAQPHGRRHLHDHQHVKEDTIVTIAEKSYAYVTGPPNLIISPSTAQPIPPAATLVQKAADLTPVKAADANAAGDSSSNPEGSGYGFSYSPYLANGKCKDQAQVDMDFKAIDNGYSLVRIYGTDCNQTATVLAAAKNHKMKLFAGIYNIDDVKGEVQKIIAAADGNWDQFDTISVGNELVNAGTAASKVVAALGTARETLQGAKYNKKIVIVDTLVAARANPSICDTSDYCAVNCHPFFDGNVAAADSGKFLQSQIPTLRNVLANKNQEIVITETGWPWKGGDNGAAKPSADNQNAALKSIKSAFSSKKNSVILFTAFNDIWKKNNNAQFGAEHYWGMLGDAPSG